MSQSSVLQLSSSDFAYANGPLVQERDRSDVRENWNQGQLDNWAGAVTASCSTRFHYSGSAADLLGEGGIIGTAYTPVNRVLKEVVAWATHSGSGGVSTIDIKLQYGSFSTAFVNNNVFRPAVSSSDGNYGLSRKSNFVSGSNMVWRAGTLMRAELTTAAGAAGVSGQKGLTVEVLWAPSASYGDGR